MRKVFGGIYQGDLEDAITFGKENRPHTVIVYLGQELVNRLRYDCLAPLVHIPLRDGGDNGKDKLRTAVDIIAYLVESGRMMSSVEKNILVACRAGISRSPAILVGCGLRWKMPFEESYNHVKTLIPHMNPEPHLLKAVREAFS